MAKAKSVESEIRESVKAAVWLTEADAGAVAVVYRLAYELDQSVDVAQMVQLSKALQSMLTALGMTVAGRVGKAEPEEEVNPLEGLRKRTAEAISRESAGAVVGPVGD